MRRCATGIRIIPTCITVTATAEHAKIMLKQTPKPELTVWYNTRCPVCDAGISWQKRRLIEAVKAGRIAFRDINLEPAALAGHGASLEDIRRRLHATDVNGRLLVGADVAIAVWAATPGEGWLAALFGNPVALPLTRFAYDRFADLLYAWNRRKGRW
jgi:predicted DCC family thiol-disulfide oxidoreductase YuxK